MKGVLYYELLQLRETINSDRYSSRQLLRLSEEMEASRLPTLRLTTATHSSRCLGFPLFKRCEWLVVNCNMGKRVSFEEIYRKRPYTGKGLFPVKLLHDNARPHVKPVKETLLTLGWNVLPGLFVRYSVILFRSMQNALSEVHFRKVEKVQKWIDVFIKSKDETFFTVGIHKLPERWRKVVDNGEYFYT